MLWPVNQQNCTHYFYQVLVNDAKFIDTDNFLPSAHLHSTRRYQSWLCDNSAQTNELHYKRNGHSYTICIIITGAKVNTSPLPHTHTVTWQDTKHSHIVERHLQCIAAFTYGKESFTMIVIIVHKASFLQLMFWDIVVQLR